MQMTYLSMHFKHGCFGTMFLETFETSFEWDLTHSDQQCSGQKWFGLECVCVLYAFTNNFKKINLAWQDPRHGHVAAAWLQCVAFPSFYK